MEINQLPKTINFTDPNIQGKIVKAFVIDLRTKKKYPLTEKKERSGGKSRNLFFEPIKISIDDKKFILQFRIDFNDKRIDSKKNDPVLDLEINGSKNIGKNIHNTFKSKKDDEWHYDLRDKMVKINGENVPINYLFILEMTKQQSISAKARITKQNPKADAGGLKRNQNNI